MTREVLTWQYPSKRRAAAPPTPVVRPTASSLLRRAPCARSAALPSSRTTCAPTAVTTRTARSSSPSRARLQTNARGSSRLARPSFDFEARAARSSRMVFSILLDALRSWNWRFSANADFCVSASPLLGRRIELARQNARFSARSAERANTPTGQTSSQLGSDRAASLLTCRDARILGHIFRDFPTSGDSRTPGRCCVRRSCDARFSHWLSRADQITR